MVEAGIALPIVILTVMLLIRLFVFYLEIVSTGISEHMKVMEAWDSYNGAVMKIYESSTTVTMLGGGMLKFDVGKEIESKAYFFNEDNMVRAGEIVEKE